MTSVFPVFIAALISAPAVLPAPGSNATYHYVFRGRFWNGTPVEANRTDALKNTSGALELSKRDNASDKTTTTHGTINADGTVALTDGNAPSDPFAPYNSIALLVHGAPSYRAGAKWNTSLAVQTGQTAASVTQVPVTAMVAKVDGDVVTIQGTGTISTTSTYGDYTDPIDLSVEVAARFQAGQLERADYQATEYVHAGPLSQTMTWSWSLSAQS
jgi:uncharacterized protein involved in outer membrane biogenesis